MGRKPRGRKPKHELGYYKNLVMKYANCCWKEYHDIDAKKMMRYLELIGEPVDFDYQTLNAKVPKEVFKEIKTEIINQVGTVSIDTYITANLFDFKKYYEVNKGKAFCGIDYLGKEINRYRKAEADSINEINALKREKREMQKQIYELRDSIQKTNEKYEVEKGKVQKKLIKLALESKEKEALQKFIDGQYDDFSRIYKELMVGNNPEISDFQAAHSFLGEPDKQTPPLAVIQQSYSVESAEDEFKNMFKMED